MSGSRPIGMTLFLDVDNVLNHASEGQDLYNEAYEDSYLALDRSKVEMLRKLFDKYFHLKTVLISDWRLRPDFVDGHINPCWFLREHCKWLNIIGDTPKKLSSEHWHEVKWWIDDNQQQCEAFIILDDFSYPKNFPSRGKLDLSKHCITVDMNKGLQESDISAALISLDSQCSYIQKDAIQKALHKMEADCAYLINDQFECSFSYNQFKEWDGVNTMFSEWQTCDAAKQTAFTNVNVQVYDQKEAKYYKGRITLQQNMDLSFGAQLQSSLMLMENEDVGWERLVEIRSVECARRVHQ